jgi:hypothetical protein
MGDHPLVLEYEVDLCGYDAAHNGHLVWASSAYWIFGQASEAVPGTRTDFSPLEGLLRLPVLPHDEYHGQSGIGSDEQLFLPDTLADSFDRLAALGPNGQNQFLRAAYWLNHARRVWELSVSASLIAVAQAIEALLPEAEGSDVPSAESLARCQALVSGSRRGSMRTRRMTRTARRYTPFGQRLCTAPTCLGMTSGYADCSQGSQAR